MLKKCITFKVVFLSSVILFFWPFLCHLSQWEFKKFLDINSITKVHSNSKVTPLVMFKKKKSVLLGRALLLFLYIAVWELKRSHLVKGGEGWEIGLELGISPGYNPDLSFPSYLQLASDFTSLYLSPYNQGDECPEDNRDIEKYIG